MNTPKIDYDEKPIELKSTSLKRRDENDLNIKNNDEDSQKFKKIKIKHQESDDEDTIIIRSNVNNESLDNQSDRLDISDHDKLKDNNNLFEEASSSNKVANYLSNKSKIIKNDLCKLANYDEDGFLICDDNDDETTTNQRSSQENENILDVTDYDQFKQEDESIDNQTGKLDLNSSPISNKEKNTTKRIKRIKKFVKKHQPKQTAKKSINLIEHQEEEDSEATIIDKNQLNLPIKDNLNSNDADKILKKKEMKTNFAEFFKNENISKSSANDTIEVANQIENKKNEQQQQQQPAAAKKRGRPRKSVDSNDKKFNAITTKTDKLVKVKVANKTAAPEILIDELDNDCELVEFVNNNKVDENAILNNKNNSSKVNLSSSVDDNTIIMLNKKEEEESGLSVRLYEEPWTIKYKPLNTNQILDNQHASKKIKDWISDFNAESIKTYYEEEDLLESCILITGPTGSGKTAMVYALAEELNYKVFEINCSSKRNSKFINQIKEATLSHTVSRLGDNFKSPIKKQSEQQTNSKQKTLFNFFQKKKPSIDQSNPLIDESSFSQETVNNLKALSINSNSL